MRRTVGLLLILVLAGSAVATAGEDPPESPPTLDDELRSVATLTARGDYAEALSIASRLIADHPASVKAHIAYQDLRLAAGDRRELQSQYAKRAAGREAKPDDVYLHARLLTGSRGISLLKKVLRAEPAHFHALCSLGSAYTEAGKLRDAESTLNLAAQAGPDSAVPLCCTGWVKELEGDATKAEEYYRRAIECDPGHAVSHLNLGVLLMETGRLEEAGASLQAARKLAPCNPMPLLAQGMLASALAEAAKDAEADEAAEDSDEGEGGEEGGNAEEGEGAEGGGEKDADDGEGEKDGKVAEDDPGATESRKLFEQAVEMETNTFVSLNMLGSTYVRLGEYELARQCFSRALEMTEDNILPKLNLTHLYLVQNLTEKALGWAKQALRADAKSPEAHYLLGLCLAAQGKRKAAEKSYKRASELDSGNILYLRALGTLYMQLGKWREAVGTLTHAIDLDPESLDLLLDLAFAYSGAGDAKRAATTFEDVLARDADVLTAWLNVGLLYQEKLRRPDMAITAFEEYLERGGKDERVKGWLEELQKK